LTEWFIANQTCTFRVVFQHELACVKGFELGTMPDTDNGGFRESF
jgi:hypothetical protein